MSDLTTPGSKPRWLPAIGLGLAAAVLGGAAWGVLAAFSGFIFVWVAIALGLFVAAAVRYGARTVTPGVIYLAAFLTLFAVFIGDIIGVAISVTQAGYEVALSEVIAAYPDLVALAPVEAIAGYLFGAIGALVGGLWLHRDMRWGPRLQPYGRYPAVGPPRIPAPGSRPTLERIARSTTLAAARIAFPGPPGHVIEASYDTMFGSAKVFLDGQPLRKMRVWGFQKVVDVPLSGALGHTVSLRFYGTITPRIDVSIDGYLRATI